MNLEQLMDITPSPSQSTVSSQSSVSTLVNGPDTENESDDDPDIYAQMRQDEREITVNVGVQVNTETRTNIAVPAYQAIEGMNQELERFRLTKKIFLTVLIIFTVGSPNLSADRVRTGLHDFCLKALTLPRLKLFRNLKSQVKDKVRTFKLFSFLKLVFSLFCFKKEPQQSKSETKVSKTLLELRESVEMYFQKASKCIFETQTV